MKYLVTDDSKLARKVLKKSLCEYVDEQYIFEACNGLEALKILLKEKADIVFLDLTMPVMDGYETIPKILDINPETKIIVVSADVQEKAKEKVLSLGAMLHIEKPINPVKMKEILEAL
ncbi:response regulator [Sulfurimonas sp. NWX79]|uniref:response regulator n=1 Tax=Sulfurimonas sp. NWX79 TaxID=2925412 RepID=UPI003204C7AF